MGGAISYASPSSFVQAAICGGKGEPKADADYLNLTCPVKYEEITREAHSKLFKLHSKVEDIHVLVISQNFHYLQPS